MADDKIREGSPEKSRKKKAPPDGGDRPRKKRPAEDEDEAPPKKKKPAAKDEDEELPKKKKKIAKDEDTDAEDDDDSGGSALSAVVPVGGSLFALFSLWFGLIAFVLAIVALGTSLNIITVLGYKPPGIVTLLLPLLWPITLLSGVVSFFTHKHKASYGSIAGNIRAIIGILLSLATMLVQVVLVYLFFTTK